MARVINMTIAPAAEPLPLNLVVLAHSQGFGMGSRLAALLAGATVTERAFGNATFVASAGFEVGVTPYPLKANFASDMAGLWDADADNRLVVWAGLVEANDQPSSTLASVVADAEELIAHALAAHAWQVHLVTIIACAEYDAISPHPTRGNLAPLRNAISDAFVAGLTGAASAIDLRTIPELQDAYDGTYFSDGIHLTDASGGGRDKAAAGIAAAFA